MCTGLKLNHVINMTNQDKLKEKCEHCGGDIAPDGCEVCQAIYRERFRCGVIVREEQLEIINWPKSTRAQGIALCNAITERLRL